jgi:hypothetical protein
MPSGATPCGANWRLVTRRVGYGEAIGHVNDRMQRDYRYARIVPLGREFHPEFKPHLTPAQMLEPGVFCCKYMSDVRDEFPRS